MSASALASSVVAVEAADCALERMSRAEAKSSSSTAAASSARIWTVRSMGRGGEKSEVGGSVDNQNDDGKGTVKDKPQWMIFLITLQIITVERLVLKAHERMVCGKHE